MVRQIIIPTNNTYMLELPDELIGREVEVLAFEVENEAISNAPSNSKPTIANTKPSNIFKDCRVDLTNYKFDRDAVNNYE